MTRAQLIEIVAEERRRAHDAIEDAYWRFTRQAKTPPPAVTVPWAYDVRNEMDRRLRALRAPTTNRGTENEHDGRTL